MFMGGMLFTRPQAHGRRPWIPQTLRWALQDVRAKLATGGVDAERNSPEEMAEMMKAGVAKFGKIIRDAGIKPE
jgi:hypothetical protein